MNEDEQELPARSVSADELKEILSNKGWRVGTRAKVKRSRDRRATNQHREEK